MRALLCLALLGCTGQIAEPDVPPVVEAPPRMSLCGEGAASNAPLLRMDRETYVGALETLFGSEVRERVSETLAALPEAVGGRYRSATGAASAAEVRAYLDVATDVAYEVTGDAALLTSLDPCLAEPAPESTCIAGFVDSFGRRLLRRPITEEERARFLEGYAIGAADDPQSGVATLLMRMLMDPRFLYFFEDEGPELRAGVAALTSHELAARLARTLWSSTPDDELLAAADRGLEGAVLDAELERMWADPRAEGAFQRFVGEWLHLPASTATDASLQFAASVAMDEGGFADLLLDRRAFIPDAETAEVYGLDPETRGEVMLPAEERAGLLTRVAWLQSVAIPGTNAGHIIKRGERLGQVLCNPLPPPDPDAFPDDDPAEPSDRPMSIRERFQEATAEATCASCHVRLDAMGAPFGHYGADGSWIDEEVIEHDDTELRVAIDTESSLLLDDENVVVADALALSEVIGQSPEAAECFADQLAESFAGRPLDRNDGCLVAGARQVLADPTAVEDGTAVEDSTAPERSIRAAVFALLRAPAFSERQLPEEEE
ncbi:MAG: DUF1592 domain-containing protein [Myxococcota bacterium]